MNHPSLHQARPADVLLVDDDDNDAFLTQEGFRRARLAVNMARVTNGEECLAYLRNEAPFKDAAQPDLILLDLNMPIMDGREVLGEIVADDRLCHIPVVILTTSESDRDVLDMHRLRCSSYITKPISFDEFLPIIRNMGNYWFSLVVLP